MPSRRAKSVWVIALLVLVYFVAGKLGLRLAFVHANATAVWAPTGIALAAVLLLGYRIWPGILLGAFLVNVTTAGSVATSLGIAIGNTLEAVTAGYLINRFAGGRDVFSRAEDVFRFALFGGMVSTTVSATLGVTSLALAGFADWSRYGSIWLTWWLGDVGGALVVTPFLILWSDSSWKKPDAKRLVEVALSMLLLLLVGGMVFLGRSPFGDRNYPMAFLTIPFLILLAYRHGQRAAATGIVMLSGIAIWGTLQSFGPFIRTSQNESLLLLQAFLGVVSVMSLALAAVVSERERKEAALRAARDKLEVQVQERTRDLSSALEASQAEIIRRKQAEEAFRRLSSQLARLRDEERRRIARELHDSLGQDLVGVHMSLSAVARWGRSLSRDAQTIVSESLAVVRKCLNDIRTLSYVLHSPLLEDLGLEPALRNYVQGFSERSGIRTLVEVSPNLGRLSADVENALFRVVQESLTNIHRHSGSDTAQIRLIRKNSQVTLEVRDQGKGMSPEVLAAARWGVGITAMRERIAELGGELELISGLEGTTVIARVASPGEAMSPVEMAGEST